MYDKYKTLEELRDAHPKCPVCLCDINYHLDMVNASRYRPQPACTGGPHYVMSYRTYRYGKQTYYRPLREAMLFDKVLLVFGHLWKTEKTLKVSLIVIKDDIKKYKFGEHWITYSEQSNHFSKVFTIKRFQKLYKWDDRAAFLAKLGKLQKALVFT